MTSNDFSAPRLGERKGKGRAAHMKILALGLGVTLLCSSLAFAGWSEDADAPGRAASHSYRPAQGAIAVRPLDNSALNLDVAKRISDALRARGIAVADDAPLLLEFETQTESRVDDHRGRAVDASRDVGIGRRGPIDEPGNVDIGRRRDLGRSDQVDARVDLYSTSRSSVITGVRRPDMGVRYSLRATLSEATGPRLWDGYAEYGEIASDEARLYAAMAPLLASMVGQSTGERRFRAD